jgi:hypothetical protein
MTTTRTTKHVADWLAAHPAPIHKSEVLPWSERVRLELGRHALGEVLELLAHGDLEQQYQAVAAGRALGAEVWAEGEEPDAVWLVKLPGDERRRTIHPVQQLAG